MNTIYYGNKLIIHSKKRKREKGTGLVVGGSGKFFVFFPWVKTELQSLRLKISN